MRALKLTRLVGRAMYMFPEWRPARDYYVPSSVLESPTTTATITCECHAGSTQSPKKKVAAVVHHVAHLCICPPSVHPCPCAPMCPATPARPPVHPSPTARYARKVAFLNDKLTKEIAAEDQLRDESFQLMEQDTTLENQLFAQNEKLVQLEEALGAEQAKTAALEAQLALMSQKMVELNANPVAKDQEAAAPAPTGATAPHAANFLASDADLGEQLKFLLGRTTEDTRSFLDLAIFIQCSIESLKGNDEMGSDQVRPPLLIIPIPRLGSGSPRTTHIACSPRVQRSSSCIFFWDFWWVLFPSGRLIVWHGTPLCLCLPCHCACRRRQPGCSDDRGYEAARGGAVPVAHPPNERQGHRHGRVRAGPVLPQAADRPVDQQVGQASAPRVRGAGRECHLDLHARQASVWLRSPRPGPARPGLSDPTPDLLPSSFSLLILIMVCCGIAGFFLHRI